MSVQDMGSLPTLHSTRNITGEDMSDFTNRNLNQVQFYHGGNAEHSGFIDPSQPHKKVHQASFPNSAYFTKYPEEAHQYARMAVSKNGGDPHVYSVEPTGDYHQDMTQRQGGSYTTRSPLRITGEHK